MNSFLERDCFLSKGETRACLKRSGKIPSERDILMILVIGVTSISLQSLIIDVGQGSRLQDLFGEDERSLRISSLVTGSNN